MVPCIKKLNYILKESNKIIIYLTKNIRRPCCSVNRSVRCLREPPTADRFDKQYSTVTVDSGTPIDPSLTITKFKVVVNAGIPTLGRLGINIGDSDISIFCI